MGDTSGAEFDELTTPSSRASFTEATSWLWTYSAPWTLHKLLILRSSADRFRLQNPRIPLNLTVPREDTLDIFLRMEQTSILQPIGVQR